MLKNTAGGQRASAGEPTVTFHLDPPSDMVCPVSLRAWMVEYMKTCVEAGGGGDKATKETARLVAGLLNQGAVLAALQETDFDGGAALLGEGGAQGKDLSYRMMDLVALLGNSFMRAANGPQTESSACRSVSNLASNVNGMTGRGKHRDYGDVDGVGVRKSEGAIVE